VEHKRPEKVAVLPLLSAHGANTPVYESTRQVDGDFAVGMSSIIESPSTYGNLHSFPLAPKDIDLVSVL